MPRVICRFEVKCQIEFFFVVMELTFGDELRTWDDWFDEIKRLSSPQLSDLMDVGIPSSVRFAESELAEPSVE